MCVYNYDATLTFWPRKRLLVERTVKLSPGEPSVVLSADAALLTSPCFCTQHQDTFSHSHNHTFVPSRKQVREKLQKMFLL